MTDIPKISPKEAHELSEKDQAIIIDVRSPEEYQQEHIKGAYNYPIDTFSPESFAEKYKDNTQKIIFYCSKGIRATKACEKIKELDKLSQLASNLYVLDGCIGRWKNDELPIVIEPRKKSYLLISMGLITLTYALFMPSDANTIFVTLSLILGIWLTSFGIFGKCFMYEKIKPYLSCQYKYCLSKKNETDDKE